MKCLEAQASVTSFSSQGTTGETGRRMTQARRVIGHDLGREFLKEKNEEGVRPGGGRKAEIGTTHLKKPGQRNRLRQGTNQTKDASQPKPVTQRGIERRKGIRRWAFNEEKGERGPGGQKRKKRNRRLKERRFKNNARGGGEKKGVKSECFRRSAS